MGFFSSISYSAYSNPFPSSEAGWSVWLLPLNRKDFRDDGRKRKCKNKTYGLCVFDCASVRGLLTHNLTECSRCKIRWFEKYLFLTCLIRIRQLAESFGAWNFFKDWEQFLCCNKYNQKKAGNINDRLMEELLFLHYN